MGVTFSNNACSGLESGINDSTTDITIGPEGIFFPQLSVGEWFYGTISNDPVLTSQLPEIVKVTAIAIDGGTGDYDLVVERGAGLDGASPKTWNANADFQLLVSSELLNDLVTGGISVAGQTSWLLNSKTVLADYTITVEDNGYYISANPGATDITLDLPPIPASGTEDIRYFINKKSLTTEGTVFISAESGETVNGYNTMDLRQQYSTVMLHAAPGTTNWNATEAASFDGIPDDGNVYGVSYGPVWVLSTEEAPQDGDTYVRKDGDWVAGVEEAPSDGLSYARKDEGWISFEANGGGDTFTIPSGIMTPYAGAVKPAGFLWCDGQSFGRSAYPELFSAIGTNYGAVDSTSFNVPDLRGRTARGLDNLGGAANANTYPGRTTLGGVGGTHQVILSVANMPAHSHSIGSGGSHSHTGSDTTNNGNHSHTVSNVPVGQLLAAQSQAITAIGSYTTKTTSSAGSHSHTVNISSTGTSHSHSCSTEGSGSAFSNASPFIDVNWIIHI